MNKVIFDPREHKYFDEEGHERKSVTWLLNHFGMTPDYEKFGNDTARDFGTVVHRVCELYDRGEMCQYSYDPAIDPWLNGYKKFLKEFRPKWNVIEEPLISKVWGFSGTPDRAGIIRSIQWEIDLKTGTEDASHQLQTAGYEILIEENLKIKIKKRASLYLMPDDFRLVEHKNRSDRSVFIGLAQAFNWKKNHNLIGA